MYVALSLTITVSLPSEAKVFRDHAPPQGACDNLLCTLKIAGQFASWRGQLGGHDLGRFAVAEQVENHK